MADEQREESKETHPTRTLRRRRSGTAEFQRFHIQHRAVVDYTLLVTNVVTRADEVVRIATKVLVKNELTEMEQEEYERKMRDGGGVTKSFRTHRDMFVQMILCRAVDNFLCFVAELLHAIFLARPEALRSSEQERLDFILQYSSFDELVAAIAEKRVYQLSYQGMEAIAAYFKDRLGLTMFSNEDERNAIIELIQMRNLIVHNRGKVNAIHIAKNSTSTLKVGDLVDLDPDQFFEAIDRVCAAGIHLDEAARSKFALPAIEATPAEPITTPSVKGQ